MKLSLDIIRTELEKHVKIESFGINNKDLHLEKALGYTGEAVPDYSILYICDLRNIPGGWTEKSRASLIVVGGMLPKSVRDRTDWILVESNIELCTVWNRIIEIFDRYNSWEREMLRLTGRQMTAADLEQFLEISSFAFQNGLSILDANFKIIAENRVNIKYGDYPAEYVQENKRDMPAELVSQLKFNEQYQEIFKRRGCFYYEDDILPHRCLCRNIFLGEKFAYRLIVTECVRPLCSTDEILLAFCAEFLEHGIAQTDILQVNSHGQLARILTKIIRSGIVNRSALRKEAEKKAWGLEDSYRVLYIQPSAQDDYFWPRIIIAGH